ncbi:MAG: Uma2 family endonuclease [Ktedonobacterales bacterium]|nr:Uma2 family endonuclease [Ktedonobacterales bacterium]
MAAQPHPLTAEEFAALPREGLRLELVRGELRAMPPAFSDHGSAAMRLGSLLGHYILAHELGEIYAAETGFLLARHPDTVRAPDFAFIQTSRVVPEALMPSWNPIVPDLVVEVVSSSDRRTEVREKIRMWLEAGVRLVWVVYPPRRMVEQHRPQQPVVTLARTDTLDGGDVLPGFTLPLARVFG